MKKFYPLLCLFIFTVSCDKDNIDSEDSLKNTPEPDFIISSLDLQEIQKDERIFKVLKSQGHTPLTKSSRSDTSFIYDTINNIVIDITHAKKIVSSNGKYHSYTFPIISNDKVLQNILYSLQADGSYKTFKVSYKLTETEKEKLRRGQNINLYGKGS